MIWVHKLKKSSKDLSITIRRKPQKTLYAPNVVFRQMMIPVDPDSIGLFQNSFMISGSRINPAVVTCRRLNQQNEEVFPAATTWSQTLQLVEKWHSCRLKVSTAFHSIRSFSRLWRGTASEQQLRAPSGSTQEAFRHRTECRTTLFRRTLSSTHYICNQVQQINRIGWKPRTCPDEWRSGLSFFHHTMSQEWVQLLFTSFIHRVLVLLISLIIITADN